MKIPRDTCADLGGYFRHLIPGQSMWDLWWKNWHWVSGFFTRVVQFSPVSIVPPLLHARSLASRRRCIILTVDSIVKHTHLHARVSSYQFVYRDHIREKFNRGFRVLGVFCFYPVPAATVLGFVFSATFVCTRKYLVDCEVHICIDIPISHKALT